MTPYDTIKRVTVEGNYVMLLYPNKEIKLNRLVLKNCQCKLQTSLFSRS